MKRFITAMLTLALITGLSSGKASAQDRMQPQPQLRDSGYFTGMVGKWYIGYEPAGQVVQASIGYEPAGQVVQASIGYEPAGQVVQASIGYEPAGQVVQAQGPNSLIPVAGANYNPGKGASLNGFQRYRLGQQR